jgi:hypothetical protein
LTETLCQPKFREFLTETRQRRVGWSKQEPQEQSKGDMRGSVAIQEEGHPVKETEERQKRRRR